MKRVLVCQHVGYEPLGTLDPLLRASGYRIRYVNFGRDPDARPRLDGYDGLVILGGPMSADEVDKHPFLEREAQLVREAIDGDKPLLGICLGAQIMARALGGRVMRAPRMEVGWHDVRLAPGAGDDPVLGHFRPVERLFQWHQDTFVPPPGAEHLASSEVCPAQAFRVGERAYAMQFHLEADRPMIERWLRVPARRAEVDALKLSADAIREETRRRIERLHALADRAFRAFLALAGERRRRVPLPSR